MDKSFILGKKEEYKAEAITEKLESPFVGNQSQSRAISVCFKRWSGREDSDLRSQDPQPCALGRYATPRNET